MEAKTQKPLETGPIKVQGIFVLECNFLLLS